MKFLEIKDIYDQAIDNLFHQNTNYQDNSNYNIKGRSPDTMIKRRWNIKNIAPVSSDCVCAIILYKVLIKCNK